MIDLSANWNINFKTDKSLYRKSVVRHNILFMGRDLKYD